MSPISPKSHLSWKAKVTPGRGYEPVALLREASECCISVFALPKRAALPSQVGNPDISTPAPTNVGTGMERKGWVRREQQQRSEPRCTCVHLCACVRVGCAQICASVHYIYICVCARAHTHTRRYECKCVCAGCEGACVYVHVCLKVQYGCGHTST